MAVGEFIQPSDSERKNVKPLDPVNLRAIIRPWKHTEKVHTGLGDVSAAEWAILGVVR